MSYNTIADIAGSGSFTRRLYAAAASEQIADFGRWVDENRWYLAASPGWAAAWESAVAGDNDDPGADDAVITDAMILSAVQDLHGGPPSAPPPSVNAVAGTPGYWEGIDGTTLTKIKALNDLGLDLGDAWETGEWVEYGPNGRNAHWTGAKFAAGYAP